MARKGELTEKQKPFVEEYLVDLNAAAAYRRAGYKVSKEAIAKLEGHRLLTKPLIIAAVSAAQGKRSQRTQITADQVLAELARIGFSRMDKFSNW